MNNNKSPELWDKKLFPEMPEKEFIDESRYENFILKAKKVNEGNRGTINLVETKDLPEELLMNADLEDSLEIGKNPEFAMKMLKIYSSGEGRREFEMQQKAYDIIARRSREEKGKDFAKIPKPIFFKEVKITNPALIEKLKSEGVIIYQNKAEIIIMDYVHGEDFATRIYKEVVKRHSKTTDMLDSSRNLHEHHLKELIARVGEALDFEAPGKKSRDMGLRNYEEEAVNKSNMKKILKYLESSDFVLDENIIKKLKNSMEALHEQGFYHGDAHERNIMLDNGDVYLVDFGSSYLKGENIELIHGGHRLVSDDTVIRRYETLTLKQRTEEKDIIELKLKIKKLKSKLGNNAGWMEFSSNLRENTGQDIVTLLDELSKKSKITPTNDLYWDLIITALHELYLFGRDANRQIEIFLENPPAGIIYSAKVNRDLDILRNIIKKEEKE